MFEEKEMEVWKAALMIAVMSILMILFGMWMLNDVPVEASTSRLNADEALGGWSYYMNLYIANGGDLNDCLPDTYTVSGEEREVLYRIVEAEVTGTGDDEYELAKANVASCIITRWENGWANSITDVVFQVLGGSYQFTPIIDKRYWSVVVTDQTKRAVDKVLKYGKLHDSTYFCTKTCDSYKNGFHSKLQFTFDDCEHAYFKEW